MDQTSEYSASDTRLMAMERRLNSLRWVLLIEALAIAALVVACTRLSRAPVAIGSRVQMPFRLIGSNGNTAASIDEFSKASPLSATSKWLELTRPVDGVDFTLYDQGNQPGIQLITGRDADNTEVRSIRIYGGSGSPCMTMETLGRESIVTMVDPHRDQTAIQLRSTDSGSQLILSSEAGTGFNLSADKRGDSLIMYNTVGNRAVQMAGGDDGGWIGVFPPAKQFGGPWTTITSSSLKLHPDGTDSTTVQLSSDKLGGKIDLTNARGAKLFHVP